MKLKLSEIFCNITANDLEYVFELPEDMFTIRLEAELACPKGYKTVTLDDAAGRMAVDIHNDA